MESSCVTCIIIIIIILVFTEYVCLMTTAAAHATATVSIFFSLFLWKVLYTIYIAAFQHSTLHTLYICIHYTQKHTPKLTVVHLNFWCGFFIHCNKVSQYHCSCFNYYCSLSLSLSLSLSFSLIKQIKIKWIIIITYFKYVVVFIYNIYQITINCSD